MVPAQEKVLPLKIQRIATKIPDLEHLIYEETLKEMLLTKLNERRKRGDLITILYKLIKSLEGRYKKFNNEKEKERLDI